MAYTSTVLITGGTSGLGYETALQIAQARPDLQVVICSRTGAEAADQINSLTGQSNVVYLELDLSSHADTRSFVDTYLSKAFPPISGLVLNAALQLGGKMMFSPDGTEMMFSIIHVNQALLFFLIRSHLTPTARIILVGSTMHDPKFGRAAPPNYTTAELAAHPVSDKNTDSYGEAMRRYALAKFCNIMFAYALHDRSQWSVMALDPGIMPTNLLRWMPAPIRFVLGWTFRSGIGQYFYPDNFPTATSAAMLVKLTIDPAYTGREKSGKYYGVLDAQEVESSPETYDKALQKDLWDWTIRETAEGDEAVAFQGQ